MDCALFRDQYSEFADGFLFEAAEVAMMRHMTECEACRRLDAAYHTGASALRGIPALAVSPGFHDQLQARILIATTELEPQARWKRWPAGALSLVAILSVVGWQFADHSVPTGRLSAPGFVVRFAGDSAIDYPGHVPMIPVRRTLDTAQVAPASFQVTIDHMFVP